MDNYEIKNNSFYLTLTNPIFIGQSRADDNGDYIMVFEANGNKYGFKHNLFN